MAAMAGLGAGLRRSWRLAASGDVFGFDRPLERDAALRLVRAFAADPQVESILVDRMARADPPVDRRMRER